MQRTRSFMRTDKFVASNMIKIQGVRYIMFQTRWEEKEKGMEKIHNI